MRRRRGVCLSVMLVRLRDEIWNCRNSIMNHISIHYVKVVRGISFRVHFCYFRDGVKSYFPSVSLHVITIRSGCRGLLERRNMRRSGEERSRRGRFVSGEDRGGEERGGKERGCC